MAGERRFTDAHGALIYVETGKYFHLFIHSEITISRVLDAMIVPLLCPHLVLRPFLDQLSVYALI